MILEAKIVTFPLLIVSTLKIVFHQDFSKDKKVFNDEAPGDNFPAVFLK